jgi:elongation factor 1-gamma
MVAGKLYTYPDNFRAQKALIAAKYSGAQLTVPADFVFGETNKTPEFIKKFPLGKVPAFEGSDGVLLTESNAIAYYVANEELRGGSDAASRAQVVQWMSWADNEVLPASCTWVFPCMGIMQFNKSNTERAKDDVKAALENLNSHLLTRTFLVGERLSLADISVACTMLNIYKHVLDPSFRKAFTNVTRWFTTVINQPNVKAVIGEFTLCTKMAEFDAKKFAEFSGKGAGDKKGGKGEKKKEEKKVVKEEKKPKAEKKEKPVEDGGDDGFAAMGPKKKDPLDELPKGTFDLEEWKRFYSNNDEEESVKWFWEHFDTENYSIWKGDYKYNDELTLVFMSCNLIGGMFQRLEKMKKNAFASSCLFGENNNSSISGLWIWKGQNLAFELSEDWQIDYASYDWKKLDPSTDATKALVKQYWKWEGEDAEGRKFNQGKILK